MDRPLKSIIFPIVREFVMRALSRRHSSLNSILFCSLSNRDINEKLRVLRDWHNSGKHGYTKAGCLLIGYEAYRTLVFYYKKRNAAAMPEAQLNTIKKKVEETLLKPGADLVICDEGHMIKNRKSATSLSVNKIKTKRRIILTGTPIQNNLKECNV